MEGRIHGSARTTPRIRAELQASKESNRKLAARYRLNVKTVIKWRSRTTTQDARILQVGETVRLIWTPPVSDLNGWSEQPSEIAMSYLLIAKVVSVAGVPTPTDRGPRFMHQEQQQYAFEILACERLLTALKASALDSGDWRLQTIGGEQGVHLAWDEVFWCGRATVEGLVYLTANTRNEALLALLLEPDGDEIMGLFSLHIDPGGSDFGFGRKRLTVDEKRSVQQALERACLLHDTQPAYLVADGS